MSQPPPPYEPTPGENESQADSPADSVISNVQDRERLLKRAETLRDKADETDKRRAVLKRAYEDARRTGQHWEAFRLKHEMDRAVQETRELHAKAARRFYQGASIVLGP